MLSDPTLSHVYFDISWDEVAKYAVSSPEAISEHRGDAEQVPGAHHVRHGQRRPGRPGDAAPRVHDMWDPIWAQLTPEASQKVRMGNYERIFDAARVRVRAWEAANVK